MKTYLCECISSSRDNQFDLVYPPEVRTLSSIHWTPISVACQAAEFLVPAPGTRVLDIGCGPGKFCTVGALTTKGKFTGVEQRKHLYDIACSVTERSSISNVTIMHSNIADIEFSNFDTFYLYNPFEENWEKSSKIDSAVILSVDLYRKYAEHVARQLALAPLGTRIATYFGYCEEVPLGYTLWERELGQNKNLQFWEKTYNPPSQATWMRAKAMAKIWRFTSDTALTTHTNDFSSNGSAGTSC
ncbi:MAG TPA: class I SAM-dependent methyltransferase [Verrucomicrobiae bacterium]|jgi:SAM-dependent methyltransferase